MEEHTKEPWKVEVSGGGFSCVYSGDGSAKNMFINIVDGRESQGELSEADARRIVACVNAMEGLDPAKVRELIDAVEAWARASEAYSDVVAAGCPISHAAADVMEHLNAMCVQLRTALENTQ